MSDFWLGVIAVPAAAVAAAVIYGAVLLALHAYWHWSGEYWFRRRPLARRRSSEAARLAAGVFNARQVRPFRLAPGCLILVVRDYAFHSDGVGELFYKASNALNDVATDHEWEKANGE